MQVFQGIAVSPGVVIGEAVVMDHEGFRIPRRFVARDAVESELERLDRGIEAAGAEIARNEETVSRELGSQYGAIFNAHLQMLRDPKLRMELEELIRQRHYSPEYAVSRVMRRYAKVFENLDSGYMAERSHDIFDIEKRLLGSLLGDRREDLSELTSPVLVLANNLTPSETVNLNRKFVKGLATQMGGASSHTAIVAAALEIPAVVGLGPFLSDVSGGEMVIIDGDHGQVILNPDEETVARYKHEAEEHRLVSKRLESVLGLPAETRDGTRVNLMANIEFPHEVQHGLALNCDGIGLYRTEFLYLGASAEPTEEDHYQAYCEVLEAMGDKPVVIRTIDLGADKLANLEHQPVPEDERNPFLGLRSIRLALRNPELFRTQLRAVLRSSAKGRVRLMFPLISTLGEMREANRILDEIRKELEAEGIEFDHDIHVGMMVEVPAAALTIERFAPEASFVSIGTNDLIQYALAVDRGNKDVANLYSASDPAVIKLIDLVIRSAAAAEMPVSLCGQMSSSPMYTMLLLGMGLREMSVTPSAIPEIKQVCRSVTLDACEEVARHALLLDTAEAVTLYLKEMLQSVAPELAI